MASCEARYDRDAQGGWRVCSGRSSSGDVARVPPGERSLFPLDGEFNLPKDSYSHGLRERLASEVARDSFDEAMHRASGS